MLLPRIILSQPSIRLADDLFVIAFIIMQMKDHFVYGAWANAIKIVPITVLFIDRRCYWILHEPIHSGSSDRSNIKAPKVEENLYDKQFNRLAPKIFVYRTRPRINIVLAFDRNYILLLSRYGSRTPSYS